MLPKFSPRSQMNGTYLTKSTEKRARNAVPNLRQQAFLLKQQNTFLRVILSKCGFDDQRYIETVSPHKKDLWICSTESIAQLWSRRQKTTKCIFIELNCIDAKKVKANIYLLYYAFDFL